MALGRVIAAIALVVAAAILLMGNVRCSNGPDPLARPEPATVPPTPAAESGPDIADEPVADVEPSPIVDAEDTDADGVVRIPVTLGDRTFQLELAADPGRRTRGLMDRERIAPDGGMLFVFSDVAMRSFWMKNCLTDMDIAYLDGSGRVTAIHTMTVEPPRGPTETEFMYELRMPGYSSFRPAQFAIEVAPGTLRELGVRTGDLIPLDLPDLKRRAR